MRRLSPRRPIVYWIWPARWKRIFGARVWPAERAVAHAIERSRAAGKPIVLADTQDNPGGGAEGDTVGVLAELVGQGAEGAALAILIDPAAAAAAHAAGEGTEIEIGLGAGSGLPGHRPFEARYRIEALGSGRFTGTGPFYSGARMDLGPMALLSLGGVKIVIASRKLQAADQAIFRHLGVEPGEQKILALKSSVHFRADFGPIAEEVLVVAAPGPNPIDHLAPGLPPFAPGSAPDTPRSGLRRGGGRPLLGQQVFAVVIGKRLNRLSWGDMPGLCAGRSGAEAALRSIDARVLESFAARPLPRGGAVRRPRRAGGGATAQCAGDRGRAPRCHAELLLRRPGRGGGERRADRPGRGLPAGPQVPRGR